MERTLHWRGDNGGEGRLRLAAVTKKILEIFISLSFFCPPPRTTHLSYTHNIITHTLLLHGKQRDITDTD